MTNHAMTHECPMTNDQASVPGTLQNSPRTEWAHPRRQHSATFQWQRQTESCGNWSLELGHSSVIGHWSLVIAPSIIGHFTILLSVDRAPAPNPAATPANRPHLWQGRQSAWH